MTLESPIIIRALTSASLAGLLLSAGLGLRWDDVFYALRRARLAWILPVNFILVPAAAFASIRLFLLPLDIAAGIILLAASPFAPVLPTFARLAKGNLALASALTGIFPLLSAFITPVICLVALRPILGLLPWKFDVVSTLFVLAATITLPLALGVTCRHYLPALSERLLKPIQVLAEAVGAIALIYVTVTELDAILVTGWKALMVMALLSEISFFAGYLVGGPAPAARVVVALGTANRNIALALLIAVARFPGTPIVAAVVANGLLLIGLGLVHVGLCRWIFTATALRSKHVTLVARGDESPP